MSCWEWRCLVLPAQGVVLLNTRVGAVLWLYPFDTLKWLCALVDCLARQLKQRASLRNVHAWDAIVIASPLLAAAAGD